MRRRLVKGLTISGAAVALMLGLWQASYGSQDDPKNLRYLLWKMGIASMDLDQVCATMSHDSSDKLVLGKSKAQLEQRFGFLTKPENAEPYLDESYKNSWFSGKDVLFIRHSPWAIVFENGKATNLILVKGV